MVTGEHGRCGASAQPHAELENESACAYVTTRHLSMEVKDVQEVPGRTCLVVSPTVQVRLSF